MGWIPKMLNAFTSGWWLGHPLKNMSSSIGMIIPNINGNMPKNGNQLPPTRHAQSKGLSQSIMGFPKKTSKNCCKTMADCHGLSMAFGGNSPPYGNFYPPVKYNINMEHQHFYWIYWIIQLTQLAIFNSATLLFSLPEGIRWFPKVPFRHDGVPPVIHLGFPMKSINQP